MVRGKLLISCRVLSINSHSLTLDIDLSTPTNQKRRKRKQKLLNGTFSRRNIKYSHPKVNDMCPLTKTTMDYVSHTSSPLRHQDLVKWCFENKNITLLIYPEGFMNSTNPRKKSDYRSYSILCCVNRQLGLAFKPLQKLFNHFMS